MIVLGYPTWQWLRLSRSLRWGLGVGESVSVGYAGPGHLVVRDVTGDLWMPHGGVHRVLREGPLCFVLARDLTVMLPSALVSDADAAFLEGRGDAQPDVEPPPPGATYECAITEQVQRDLATAWARRSRTSPAVLIWSGIAVFFLGSAVLGASEPVASLVLLVLAALAAWFASLPLRAVRRGARLLHPVGSTVRGSVERDAIVVAGTHSMVRTPWTMLRGHRLTPRVLELRRRDGVPMAVRMLPTALFPVEQLREIVAALPRSV